MIKSMYFFLDEEDEKGISIELMNKYNNIIFLDDSLWEDDIQYAESIDKCKKKHCYIWNKSVYPELPTEIRSNGLISGPTSGIVVQMERSFINENGMLLSGRLAVGFDDENLEFKKFINTFWKIVRRIGCNRVYHANWLGKADYSKVINDFAVSENVINDLNSFKIRGLMHRSTENYYVPAIKT